MSNRSRIALITGAAPYLGGPKTWQALRRAAPDIDFVEIDLLSAAAAAEMDASIRSAVVAGLRQVDGVIVHGSVARIAIETVATIDPNIPVVLLSPQLLTRITPVARAARAFLAGPLGRPALLFAARMKRERLRSDRANVRNELATIVAAHAIDEELVDEAVRRVESPLTARAVERTAEVVRLALEPVDRFTLASIANLAVIIGVGPMERWRQENGTPTVVASSRSAPMLDAPEAVVSVLRRLLALRK